MKVSFTGIITAAALLATAISTAAGQAAALTTTAYTGPRYPGGPDSLRALVQRSTRLTTPAPAGRMLVQFDLQPDGHPTRFTMVRPPDPLNPALVNATATALNYMEARMASWQLGTPDPDVPSTDKAPKVSLVLDFRTPTTAQPYYYGDENPVFGTLAEAVRVKNSLFYNGLLTNPAKLAKFQSSPIGLTTLVQMQVKYPPEALRGGQQGTVYAYFELAENGQIERPEILGTAGKALDAEVRQALVRLPAATAPALLQSRPVRLYYVLPVTFKMQ